MPSMPCYRMPLFREKEKMQTEKVRIDEVLEKEYKLTSWDHDIFHKVMEHWDGIAKPLDGMGQFEPMHGFKLSHAIQRLCNAIPMLHDLMKDVMIPRRQFILFF